tara:strand:+ start:314 stop:1033 length:720 start_codon:yes stop_codon:yes gene_type:complete
MSAKYTFLAWDTPIENAPLKLALLQLANNADDDGFSYYSISKMALACGMSERTFMRKISELESMKVLTVERRSNRPSLYTLIGDEMGVSLCHLHNTGVTESHPEVTACHAEVTESHLVGDRESPDLNSTPKSNPDSNPKSIALSSSFEILNASNDELLEITRIRKKNKGGAITQRVANALSKEFQIAMNMGYSFDELLTEWEVRGWKTFKAEWIKPKQGTQSASKQTHATMNNLQGGFL